MTTFHRRSFVQRLGLGLGAIPLGAIANGLIREARGEEVKRRRFLFVAAGNGFNALKSHAPVSLEDRVGQREGFEEKDYALPPAVAALAPFRNKLLMINPPNSQGAGLQSSHFKSYIFSTALPLVGGSGAGGPSIDQFIGRSLGKHSPFAAISLAANQGRGIFASARGQGVPSIESPAVAFQTIFGPLTGMEAGGAFVGRRKRLMDLLRPDITKLQSALAGRERIKMDQFLSAIDDAESQAVKLVEIKNCTLPAAPVAPAGTEDILESHFAIAAAAFQCNLTQVVSIATPGTGHLWAKLLPGAPDTHTISHSSGEALLQKIHNFHAGLITRLCQKLAAVKEGNGTMFDNTVVVWGNHNAEGHHSKGARYPIVLVGTGGGAIKADGRFIKFGSRGSKNYHSLADVYCTVAQAMGVPTDTFGQGGSEDVTGPIPTITA